MGEKLLVGVALSHSAGDLEHGSAEAGGLLGGADTSLTTILPYGRVSFERGSVWGLLGAGSGDIEMRDALGRMETDLSMGLAALGARRELDSAGPGGLRLALKGDLYSTWLTADGTHELPSETKAEAQRLRLLLEGGMDLWVSETSGTRLQLEGGGRWDGGDAAGGGGLELGVSLSHRRPGMGLEVQADGRYTVLHQAESFEDRSLSLMVSLDPGVAGEGLRLSLSPSWGNPGGGALHWLASDSAGMMGPGPGLSGGPGGGDRNAGRYEATLSYGWAEGPGMMREVYSALSDGGWQGRELRLGSRMTLGESLGLMMSLELSRTQPVGGVPDHAVMLRISSNGLGAPGPGMFPPQPGVPGTQPGGSEPIDR